jgi:hypothetical protein
MSDSDVVEAIFLTRDNQYHRERYSRDHWEEIGVQVAAGESGPPGESGAVWSEENARRLLTSVLEKLPSDTALQYAEGGVNAGAGALGTTTASLLGGIFSTGLKLVLSSTVAGVAVGGLTFIASMIVSYKKAEHDKEAEKVTSETARKAARLMWDARREARRIASMGKKAMYECVAMEVKNVAQVHIWTPATEEFAWKQREQLTPEQQESVVAYVDLLLYSYDESHYRALPLKNIAHHTFAILGGVDIFLVRRLWSAGMAEDLVAVLRDAGIDNLFNDQASRGIEAGYGMAPTYSYQINDPKAIGENRRSDEIYESPSDRFVPMGTRFGGTVGGG